MDPEGKKVRVKMLSTSRGSENGTDLTTFIEGGVYEICPDLAEAFCVHMKCAEYFKQEPKPIKKSEPKPKDPEFKKSAKR